MLFFLHKKKIYDFPQIISVMAFRPFKTPIKLLQILGFWQDKNSSVQYKIYGLILHFYILEHGSFNQTVHAINLIKKGEIVEFAETLSIAFTCYVTLFKTLIFFRDFRKIKNLMKELENLMKFSEFSHNNKNNNRQHVNFYENQIIKISNLKYTFHLTVCNMSLIVALNFYKERRLPFKTWFYFDYENNDGAYIFLIIAEYVMSIYTILVNTSLDVIPVIFICYTLAILKELRDRISGISENMHKSEVDLKKCVNLHVRIKKFCDKISKVYATHFMVQVFMSSLILCSSMFLITKVKFIFNYKK